MWRKGNVIVEVLEALVMLRGFGWCTFRADINHNHHYQSYTWGFHTTVWHSDILLVKKRIAFYSIDVVNRNTLTPGHTPRYVLCSKNKVWTSSMCRISLSDGWPWISTLALDAPV
jgi:hypothetical protein